MNQEPRKHPDIFTPAEAVEYLRLDSERSLDTLRADLALAAFRVGRGFMYHRADLDECVLKMFGKFRGTARSTTAPQLKLSGGRG